LKDSIYSGPRPRRRSSLPDTTPHTKGFPDVSYGDKTAHKPEKYIDKTLKNVTIVSAHYGLDFVEDADIQNLKQGHPHPLPNTPPLTDEVPCGSDVEQSAHDSGETFLEAW
jgi:hypothetical protein